MTDNPPPQWAIDKAEVMTEYLSLNVSDFTKKSVATMIAKLLVEERERCAKICETGANEFRKGDLNFARAALIDAARDIREL